MGARVISFAGNAECKQCHEPLSIRKIEYTTEPLELDGTRNGQMDYDYDLFLICLNCGHVEPEFIQRKDTFRVYTDLEQRLDMYNTLEKLNTKPIKSPFVKGD